ncbi:hypothetical protein JCM19235_2770 [Vibrio maritimus]|uniref:6-hydroxymethylpterin diphosphokinase MptE-like domain-containing protein n=1 Tax=Vibrio maritimus TaxID=990268 RepID=A0A090S3F4_9VIBR|nr:hypothetical protein JCM19235_2770 [Vibrio maritimus]
MKKKVKSVIRSVLPQRFIDQKYRTRCSSSQKIKQLKNKFKGERCFILGNGPSLNKCDLSLLEGEYTFGVNGIYYKHQSEGFKPTFYVVEDRHVMSDNLVEINDFDCEYKFFPVDYKHLLSNHKNCLFFNMDTGFYQKPSSYYSIPRFSMEADRVLYCGQSVTMINLQLAAYLGFDEVYLIGMDFSYDIPKSAVIEDTTITSTEDDPNHFHPDYFGAGKKWHDPQLDKVLLSYKMMDLIYKAQGKSIINATVGGKLELFERVDYYSIFQGD